MTKLFASMMAALLLSAGLFMHAQHGHNFFLGSSDFSRSEVKATDPAVVRLRTINNLLISEKNKRDLREGRLFWGAAPAMIDLAYARPPVSIRVDASRQPLATLYRYEFDGKQVIHIELHDDGLACIHFPDQAASCASGVTSRFE